MAEIAAHEIPEERAEREIAAQVIELEVQRQRRDRAPPLAVEQPPGL